MPVEDLNHTTCLRILLKDLIDFVAYIAKDDDGRKCHVMECMGGLANDVITTIGQAFELRFKQHLSQKPPPIAVPDR